ncbi:Hemolysin/hemagglutinin-like protein HecA precursor [Collimonas arenae]|uniref:Hemolysin/hemagglutinin-like protein HecA n=1 Tax=Collimonas arenae TaxID=279058 RepID=A0A0A1FGN8_9BURK|nr:CdiA family toxin C-terminal domain-containing protein [Collimonas arenae]AIY42067.1 Hemolysin/hemagglutinin-like protein HecA precursor [Collimonas arenae]
MLVRNIQCVTGLLDTDPNKAAALAQQARGASDIAEQNLLLSTGAFSTYGFTDMAFDTGTRVVNALSDTTRDAINLLGYVLTHGPNALPQTPPDLPDGSGPTGSAGAVVTPAIPICEPPICTMLPPITVYGSTSNLPSNVLLSTGDNSGSTNSNSSDSNTKNNGSTTNTGSQASPTGASTQPAFNANIENHLTSVDGFSQQSGVGGAHTTNAFNQAVTQNKLDIVNTSPGSVDGITNVTYKIPAKNPDGSIVVDVTGQTVYKNQEYTKTIYDPSIISTQTVTKMGEQAATNGYAAAIAAGKTQFDAAAGGLIFRVYIDPVTKNITNFFPK